MVGKRHWSEAEKAALSQHYSVVSNKRLQELLDDRSHVAIKNQAHCMGLRKHPERIKEAMRENVGKRYAMREPPPIET